MVKVFLLFTFVFGSSFAFSKPSLFLGSSFLLAQDDVEFDDSDLIDIEDGFDGEDEIEELDEAEKKSKDEELEEKFNSLEYEIIDDEASPDEEIIEDEELYKQGSDFAEEDSQENELEEEEADDEGLEDSFENQEDEKLEENFESPGKEDLKDQSIEKFDLENDLSSDEETEISEENETSTEEDNATEEEAPSFDIIDQSPDKEGSKEETEKDTLGDLNLISNIRFISSKNQIIIDASETTSYKVRTNESNNQLIIEILQSKLESNLKWPYVLKDFNTNFGMIKADQKTPDVVRVLIQFKEKADFPKTRLSEEGNQILIGYGDLSSDSAQVGDGEYFGDEASGGGRTRSEKQQILPAKTLEELYFGKVHFSGKPISFHVIDAPIKQVLRFISEESGLNMVIGESVTGSITLKLEEIPWDQALYTIFKVKSLGYTRDGNVITILPLKEIEQRTENLKKIAEQQKPLIPLVTKVLPVTYGKLSEIETKVKDFLTPANEANKQKGGKIISHEESNTLIVTDTEKVIEKIEKLITYLDKTPKQVMIETKIVEATENFTKNFGLRWSLGGNVPSSLNASGFLELLNNISGSYRTSSNEGSGSGTLQLSGIPYIGDITASLNIAEGENYAKVISSPKIVTISGKKASITRNSPILVTKSVTTTAEGNSTEGTETEDVKIQLDVTPTVTSIGSVFLDISVERSDPGGAGGAFKTSRNAKTEVLVQNGHTVVIGGIYEEDEADITDGIPFFKKIPFLNLLFAQYRKTNSKSELLIFLTPKLLDIND